MCHPIYVCVALRPHAAATAAAAAAPFLDVFYYKKRTNKATSSVGYALESWDLQLSNAYPTLVVALLVLVL